MKGLRINNVEIIECQDDSNILIRWPKLLIKYLKSEKSDLIFVSASNHVNIPLAFLIALFSRKRIIFDAFVSLYDTYVYDRKTVAPHSIKAKFYYYLDKIACSISDLIISDTLEHKEFFSDTFSIDKNKIKVIYVGTDDGIFYPIKSFPKKISSDDKTFKIHFHGTFIPLQGIEYIIKAAKMLENENIIFQIVGDGQTWKNITNLKNDLHLKNITFHPLVEYWKLPNYINNSDLCLGIFGSTDKAKRVIPNKIYECIAMQKPLISGDSPAVREMFTHKKDIFLCDMANAESLAESILKLRNDPDLMEAIAQNGYKNYQKNFTPKKIGEKLKKILNSTI